MGSTNSKDLSSNEYLLKFSGKTHISPMDPFWNVFLSFSFNPPSSKSENELVDDKLSKIFTQLLTNNLTSGNFVSLIRVFLNKSSDLLSAAFSGNEILLWQTYNALFIMRCFTKYLIETLKEVDYVKHFNAKPLMVAQTVVEQNLENFNNKKVHDNVLESVLESLLEILVDVPLDSQTYSLHLEVINTLLVFLSVQMYTRKAAGKSVIYRYIMQGRPSIHSPLLVKTLLGHFVKQERHSEKGGSLVIGLASGILHILSLAYKNSPPNLEPPKGITLANQSLLLILVLVNHCTSEKNLRNPYRDFLFTFVNSSQGPNQETSTSGSAFQFNLDHLYITLCHTATNECSTLLLYLLLHRNENVKNFILARADLEYLVVPILKTLYNVTESDSHHIYMSLIILLILSEDNGFGQTIHQITLKNISWYSERALTEISLGGLLVLVVIRTIHYNMLKMRDKYLHTNCLAALANMSNNFHNLHSYVSQRLLSLFETLAKKYHRLENELKLKEQSVKIELKCHEIKPKTSNSSSHSKEANEANHISSQSKDVPEAENTKSNTINGAGPQEDKDIVINVSDLATSEVSVSKDNAGDTSVDIDDEDKTTMVQDLNVLEEVLRMVLEIINSCLSNQLQHNPNLIYALLYKRNIFDAFRNHQSFQDVIQNLDTVINYFSEKLKQIQSDLSVNEVLSAITQGTLVWPSHKLKKFPELKFKYVEEEQPEDFFIPYVWSLVGHHSGINWSAKNKKIFFPDKEGTMIWNLFLKTRNNELLSYIPRFSAAELQNFVSFRYGLSSKLKMPGRQFIQQLQPNIVNTLFEMDISHVRRVRQLYKIILKMHSGLPGPIKSIGNTYVRDEFRRHKYCKPPESAVFLEEWTKYAIVLSQQLGLRGPKSAQPLGKNLTLDQLDSMSDDQIQQLYQLMLAAQGKTDEDFFGKSELKQNSGD